MAVKNRTEKSDSESLKFRDSDSLVTLVFLQGERGLRLKPFELKSETVLPERSEVITGSN